MNEMNKLIKMLAKEDIPFEVVCIDIPPYGEELPGSSIQICSPNQEKVKIDAVCHMHSYGGHRGLIEIMSMLEAKESKTDGVVGSLTAEEAFEFFNKEYLLEV